MKKILGILIALAMVMIIASPVLAAPPVYEEWDLFAADNGAVRITMTINITNLKTDHFDVYNNASYPIYLYVTYNGTTVWDHTTLAMTTEELKYTVNFQRLPATDPDDPDSIRYPSGYSFHMRN